MRIHLCVLLFIIASVLCFAQSSQKNELETFTVFKNQTQRIATIQVPSGYKEETKSYAEGVQTTLTYPDGSYIILHIGGMIKLPFLTEPTHRVDKKQVLADRIIRSGRVKNTEFFWQEENSKGVWPPTNIGFTNVPKERVGLFRKSLRTFALAK